jgi:hypothetical protein
MTSWQPVEQRGKTPEVLLAEDRRCPRPNRRVADGYFLETDAGGAPVRSCTASTDGGAQRLDSNGGLALSRGVPDDARSADRRRVPSLGCT